MKLWNGFSKTSRIWTCDLSFGYCDLHQWMLYDCVVPDVVILTIYLLSYSLMRENKKGVFLWMKYPMKCDGIRTHTCTVRRWSVTFFTWANLPSSTPNVRGHSLSPATHTPTVYSARRFARWTERPQLCHWSYTLQSYNRRNLLRNTVT